MQIKTNADLKIFKENPYTSINSIKKVDLLLQKCPGISQEN